MSENTFNICKNTKTEKLKSCLNELWQHFVDDKFEDYQDIKDALYNLNNDKIIPFMDDVYDLAAIITGEEEQPSYSENWAENFENALTKINNEICGNAGEEHEDEMQSLDDQLGTIEDEVHTIISEIEDKLGMEVCSELDGEDLDLEFRFRVCQDRSGTFSCLCRLFDIKYLEIDEDVQSLLDNFYDESFIPFLQSLQSATDGNNGDDDVDDTKCSEFLEAKDMLRELCNNTEDVDDDTKQDVIEAINDFLDAYNDLKSDLEDHGITNVCGEGNPCARKYQSDKIFLQAVGSDGSDNTSGGVHLRWAFRGDLGSRHLPKGNLTDKKEEYETSSLYNRPDDFVKLYRVPYEEPPEFEVNLEDGPDYDNNNTWKYYQKGVQQYRQLKVHFLDSSQYNSLSHLSYDEILRKYNGEIEIEWEKNLCYAVSFTFRKNNSQVDQADLEWKVISSNDKTEFSDQVTSCNQTLSLDSNTFEENKAVLCENIDTVRFSSEKGHIPSIKLRSYREFIDDKWFEWTKIDDFALSEDDSEVFNRLEDTNRFEVDNKWPRFNDGTRVNINNYQTQWTQSKGLKHGVQRYLELSTDNPLAKESLSSDDPQDQSELEVSHLKLLKIASLDYHVARMLGLGYIDDLPDSAGDDHRYVYLVKYEVKGNMVGCSPGNLQPNYFMALPTARTDHRLPLTPKEPEISYGLGNNDLNNRMFDNEGYSKFHRVRAINIKRKLFDHESEGKEFCICEGTIPAFFGIEYKEKNAQNYVKPEITNIISEDSQTANKFLSHDDDLGSVRQTHPVPDNLKSLFLHKERNEGKHVYAIYGINWFSRASPVGPETDFPIETTFPTKRPMVPFRLDGQYVQEESTLLFTSQSERSELQNRKNDTGIDDPWFTRITFLWHHLHNDQYPETKKVKFYFREKLLKEVKGEVREIDPHQDDDKKIVKTAAYDSYEKSGNIEPYIDSSDVQFFEDSYLKAGGQYFKVVKINHPGNSPEFVVQGIKRENLIEDADGNKELNNQMIFPGKGEKFTLMENFNNPDAWTKLQKEVNLIHFTADDIDPKYDPYYFEESVDEEGNKTVFKAKGIYGKAKVEDKSSDRYPGVYHIEYDDKVLSEHPESGVEWYGGIARVPVDNHEVSMREVEVLKIENRDPLILWVLDSKYEDNTKNKLQTGTGNYVNFHPGYRVYIYNEDEPALDHSDLYPRTGEKQNKLLMAARSEDDGLHSDFSNPAVILIREIEKPEKPEKPTGPTFATRPDYYGKASFTFDTKVNVSGRKPFGFIFYRATDKGILNKLYDESTLKEDVWPVLKNDEFINDRLNSLVNAELENNEPKEFGGEKLPLPDVADENDTESENIKAIQKALEKAFTPLTERPPLYDFIEEGHQTKNDPPQIKDPKTGRFIEPSSSDFNPFPFARKFTDSQGKRFIRFTDYTLDGAMQDLVFYRTREVNDEMEMSLASEAIGPITLVNSMPPEKPQIKNISSVAENPALNRKTGVKFRVEPYLETDNVEKVRVYRTADSDKISHVRLMEFAGDYPINNIKDNFSDRDFPIFGKPVFYRLIALRKIKSDYTNDQGDHLDEFVPSRPSEPVVANVIDAVNPKSPETVLHYFDMGGLYLANVKLQWNKTTQDGKYHLYKMSNASNWQKIHSITTNNDPINLELEKTDLGTNKMITEDQQGRPVYHHFKVIAENASGLLSKEENICTFGSPRYEEYFEHYKTVVGGNNGNIIKEDQTFDTFKKIGVYNNAAIFAAFSGVKLDSNKKVHKWFNHNWTESHLEETNSSIRAEWTDIFNGIEKVAIEKDTVNFIDDPDKCGDNSTSWNLVNATSAPANSFFSSFDAWKIINNGNRTDQTNQSLSVWYTGFYTFMVVVEKGTAQYCSIGVFDGNTLFRFSFDLQNGQVQSLSGLHTEYFKLSSNGPNGGEVWLLALTISLNNTSPTIEFVPDNNGNGGDTYVHFTQFENSPYFTLPVWLNRQYPAEPVLPDFLPTEDGSSGGTIYIWVDFVNDPNGPTRILEADGNNNLSLKINNNGEFELKFYDGNTHSNVLDGILPQEHKRAVRFIAITWDSSSQLHLYWGDTQGNFQKTDSLSFNPTNINTKNICPGQSQYGNDQTSVMFHFLNADDQYRDDNEIEQLYNKIRQIIF